MKPETGTSWNYRGRAYSRLEEWDKALQDLSRAIELIPDEPVCWSARGRAYAKLGQYDKGLADCSKAIELCPFDGAHWNQRAGVYGESKQWDKAIADYSKALELKPDDAGAWNNRGNAYYKLAQWDKALADYSKAIELKPESATYWSNRGGAHAELGQWKEAAADFAKAVGLNKDDPIFRYRQALARLQRGDVAGYRKLCVDMLGQFGPVAKTDSAHWAVWTCVLAADAVADWKVPLQLAERAVADNPKNYRALNYHGAVLYRAGQYQEAIKRLSEADAASQPEDQKLTAIAYNWLFLAMAHQRLGHVEEAKKWHDKAVQWIDQEMAADRTLLWNRRLALQLLRREAVGLLATKSGQ